MARPRNQIETSHLNLSTTPLVRAYLETLLTHGTYGKNAAEAAERLVTERINELRKSGDLVAESLNKTWQENQEKQEQGAEGKSPGRGS